LKKITKIVYIVFSETNVHEVDVPEWLSGMTRNHVGFARAGSNPAVHALFLLFLIFSSIVLSTWAAIYVNFFFLSFWAAISFSLSFSFSLIHFLRFPSQ
jgi:hypothetical protein